MTSDSIIPWIYDHLGDLQQHPSEDTAEDDSEVIDAKENDLEKAKDLQTDIDLNTDLDLDPRQPHSSKLLPEEHAFRVEPLH